MFLGISTYLLVEGGSRRRSRSSRGYVRSDHVPLFVSCPPHVSASYVMQRVEGISR